MATILILHCYTRNAMAIVHGLRDSEHTLIGAWPDTGHWAQAFCDRWLRSPRLARIVRHAPYGDSARFLGDLTAVCRKHGVDAVLPVGTGPTDLLSELKVPLEAQTGARVLVEPFTKLARVTDKWGIVELCRDLGVPVPRTVYVTRPADLDRAAELGWPLIVKPCSSSASKGLRFLDDAAALARYRDGEAAQDLDAYGAFVAQEVLPGTLHDVTGCAHEGEPLMLLSQERLVTLYDFGGGGLINRTTDEPDLIAAARQIIAATRWSGIIEFDFIRRPEGGFALIECNPKVWGTTQLTIDAGMNVARALVDAQLLGRNVAPVEHYEVGLVQKWWFPELFPYAWSRRPRTLRAIARRIWRTCKPYAGTRTISNVRWGQLRHLIGQTLNEFVF